MLKNVWSKNHFLMKNNFGLKNLWWKQFWSNFFVVKLLVQLCQNPFNMVDEHLVKECFQKKGIFWSENSWYKIFFVKHFGQNNVSKKSFAKIFFCSKRISGHKDFLSKFLPKFFWSNEIFSWNLARLGKTWQDSARLG